MTNPVPPPTESGWYVVEIKGFKKPWVIFMEVRKKEESGSDVNFKGDRYFWNFKWSMLIQLWNNRRYDITRYTGPLDLEELLDEGGKR